MGARTSPKDASILSMMYNLDTRTLHVQVLFGLLICSKALSQNGDSHEHVAVYVYKKPSKASQGMKISYKVENEVRWAHIL